jgi:glycosyltransferase involved in cell wall biosynthesis
VIGPAVVEGLVDSLVAERDALGLGAKVSFEGKVPIETLYDVARVAELGLWPAEYESFGISVAETMGAGLPPLMQDNRAFRYFATEGGGRLTNFAEPERAAADLIRLRDLGTEYAAVSAEVRRKAEEYGWDRVIAQVEAVYARLLQKG